MRPVPPPEDGPDHAAARATAVDRDPDEIGEVARVRAVGLGHVDPALGRQCRGVHVVHRLLGVTTEDSLEHLDGQEAGVPLRDPAEVLHRHAVDGAVLGQRRAEAAQGIGQR